MFLTSKGEKIFVFSKVAQMWSSLRKDKKKVFNFSGNGGGSFFFEGFPKSGDMCDASCQTLVTDNMNQPMGEREMW